MSHSEYQNMSGPLSPAVSPKCCPFFSSTVPNQGQAIPSLPVQGWLYLLAGGGQLVGLCGQHHQVVDDALQVSDLPQHGQLTVLRER